MSAARARSMVRVGVVVALAIGCSILVQRLTGAPAISPWGYAVLAAILVACPWILGNQMSGKR